MGAMIVDSAPVEARQCVRDVRRAGIDGLAG